jgi:hypothetical protein
MHHDDRPKTPGLKWRSRRTGPPVPYWFADPKAIAAGYTVKSANLSEYADDTARLVERCQRLQAEMLQWMSGETNAIKFDGTFGALINIYETDSESPYQKLKRGVRKSYDTYIVKLKNHIGSRRINASDGRDVKRWFAEWRAGKNGADHLPRARFVLAVLKAAVSFGIVCRLDGCRDFKAVLGELEFEAPANRTWAPTAEQVIAARKAAHAAGAPSRALVYALQFEATLRQWDIIGQWVPISDPRPSAVLHRGKKWIGPTWSAINENMIFKVKPTKTENTTAVEVAFDLSACPMVMEELAKIPQTDRTGPLIVNEFTKRPYSEHSFQYGWKADFKAAGLPEGLWNRDMRAGGVTEGGKAGASKDDRRKVAGHAREETTEIYDRDQIEAHRRVMKSRAAYRNRNKA